MAVTQLVERLLPTPDVCGSNPVIGKLLYLTFVYCHLYRKDENKEKEGRIKKLWCYDQYFISNLHTYAFKLSTVQTRFRRFWPSASGCPFCSATSTLSFQSLFADPTAVACRPDKMAESGSLKKLLNIKSRSCKKHSTKDWCGKWEKILILRSTTAQRILPW